jgi:hypothetical protein
MIEEAPKQFFGDHRNHRHLGAETLRCETGFDFQPAKASARARLAGLCFVFSSRKK